MAAGGARHFRVDPRLVHATTMSGWVPNTGAKLVLVVDPEVAEDHRRRTILEASAMGAVEVRFSDELKAAAALEGSDGPALVLFSSLEAVERAIGAGLDVDQLNVGHLPEAPARTPVHPAVHLGPKDIEIVERLEARGIRVFIQPLPSDKPQSAHRTRPSLPPTGAPQRLEAKLRVVNAKGLHLRAAHLLAHLAGTLPCDVQVGPNKNTRVNAKSLLGLTTLGAGCGTVLEITVEGPNAGDALDQIRGLFASGFDEGVDWTADPDRTQ